MFAYARTVTGWRHRLKALRVVAALGLLAVGRPAFGDALCQQFSIAGQVEGQQSYVRPIGMGLSFRMLPSGAASGWHFEIGPSHHEKGAFDLYIYAVTPPYRGRLVTMLDTEYATLAQDAVRRGPTEFWFLLNRPEASHASAALDQVLWPRSDSAQNKALSVLASLPKGHGLLRVVDSDIVPGTAHRDEVNPRAFYGLIKRISFTVQFVVPKSFVPAKGLRGVAIACPDTKDWLKF